MVVEEYDLGTLEDNYLIDKSSDRWTKLKDKFLIHATTEDKLDSIKKRGLLPRGLAGCYIWGEERVPYGISDIERILICRTNSVYFWDDIQEGLGQALATVGYLKKGNPAIVIVDIDGLRDKLRLDPEIHRWGEPDEDEPISYMYEGSIPPERIVCTCTLDKEYKPDMGKVACPMMHNEDECPNYSPETLLEEFADEPEKWVCTCDNTKLID